MRNKILMRSVVISTACILFVSCQTAEKKQPNSEAEIVQYQNDGHKLVMQMIDKVGDMTDLYGKKDVIYTYTYETPDGKKDVSTEKYIFDGELSYGKYDRHDRTFPQLEGTIEQGYDGQEYWLRHNNAILSDTTLLKRVAFNRPTNYYWFTMFQKLSDPGLDYKKLADKTIDGKEYSVVKISFESKDNKPTDIYQVYINKETQLVDQFLFTVADFGKIETPFLMVLEYENIDGLRIPTKRLYKESTWDAELNDKPWIKVTWTDIKFNNGLSKDDFKKGINELSS